MPWIEEPGRLQPMGLQKIRHNWAAYTCDHGEAMEFDGGCIRKMCCGRNRNVLVRVSSARLPPDTLLCPHEDCVLGSLPSQSAVGWKQWQERQGNSSVGREERWWTGCYGVSSSEWDSEFRFPESSPVHPIAAVTKVRLLCPQPWLPLLCSGALKTEPATDLHSFACDASGGEKTRSLQTLCVCLLSCCRVGGPRRALVNWRCLGEDKGKTQRRGICLPVDCDSDTEKHCPVIVTGRPGMLTINLPVYVASLFNSW